MGFNATRRYRDSKRHDLFILVAAVVIIAALVSWAAGLFSL